MVNGKVRPPKKKPGSSTQGLKYLGQNRTHGHMANQNASDETPDYILANRFYVEMDRRLAAWFTSCQGLSVKNNTTTVKEGGVNYQQRVVLGRVSFTEVTLTRGMTDDLEFWDWMASTYEGSQGTKCRRTINILTFNQAGETMQCWTLIGAVPVGWKAPGLKASGTDIAIEELSLAFEGLKVLRRSGGGSAVMLERRDRKGFWGS